MVSKEGLAGQPEVLQASPAQARCSTWLGVELSILPPH